MKRSFSMALVVASMLTFSCNAEQIAQVNAIAIQSKSGPAVRLATSAAIAQMALFHLAAAVSQAASNDFDDPNAAPMAPSAGPDSEFTYEVDREAGTGRIIRSHAGKRAVDLEFTFEGEGSNGGMAYAITSTNGHFEGYQLFFPRLTLLYTAILSDAFNPLKHENGNLLINVTISAVGSFGVSGVETTQLSKANLSLTYPISERELRVGEVNLKGRDGNTFEGEVYLADKVLKLKGALKDASGALEYELSTTPTGEVSLTPPNTPFETPALSAFEGNLLNRRPSR